jgi:class 3 adenylate cyclase
VSADVVARFGGTVVKHTGDGVLAVFDALSPAVSAGLELCNRLRATGLPVRVGIHAGEIERRGVDVSGIAVHVGQRVCGLADEGEVLVSRPVPDLVLGQPFTFTDRGEHPLKGAPGRWRLFRAS